MRVVRLEPIADAMDRADPRISVLQPVIVEVHGSGKCGCGRKKHPEARLCASCAHAVHLANHRSA